MPNFSLLYRGLAFKVMDCRSRRPQNLKPEAWFSRVKVGLRGNFRLDDFRLFARRLGELRYQNTLEARELRLTSARVGSLR